VSRNSCQKPKKPENGFLCCCYAYWYGLFMGCASSRSWSSFDLQTGQLSCSLSHVLRQLLSNAWPHGNSQLLFPSLPTFSRQMLQSLSAPSFIGGRLLMYSSEQPRDCGYWPSPPMTNIGMPANIPYSIWLRSWGFLPMFIWMLFVLLKFTDGNGMPCICWSPELLVKVCTRGWSIPLP